MTDRLANVMIQTVTAKGNKGSRTCHVLFDSGATDSFVSRDVAEALGTILPLDDPKSYLIADGTHLYAREGVTFTFYMNGVPIRDDFVVNPSDNGGIDDIILGTRTMRKYGIAVDFKHDDIVFSLKSAATADAPQHEGETTMNDSFKRTLARLGMAAIPDSLTDEDAITMICERAARGAHAVAVPSILTALALKEDATEVDAKTAIEALKTLKKPEPTAPSVMYAPVLTKLGLTASADITEAQAVELIVGQVKKPTPAIAVASKAIFAVLQVPDTSTEEEVVGAILAMQHPGNVVSVDQHEELEKQHRAFRLNTLVTAAMHGGKLTPAEKTWALEKVKEWDEMGLDGLTTLEKFLDKRPKLMPIGERLPVKTPSEIDLDADTMAIARQMGVSTATMKKYAA